MEFCESKKVGTLHSANEWRKHQQYWQLSIKWTRTDLDIVEYWICLAIFIEYSQQILYDFNRSSENSSGLVTFDGY